MDIFEQIVCGIDGTVESDVALAQTVRLALPDSRLVLTHAFSVAPINEVELMLGEAWEHEESRAREVLERARSWAVEAGELDTGQVETRLVPGPKAKGLLEVASDSQATLVSVGIHGRSRLAGAIRGSVASHALHSSPCAVLIARETGPTTDFPRSLACGVDGSPDARRAVDIAHELAERFKCPARYVAAEDGRDVKFSEAARQTPAPRDLEIEQGSPVDVLLTASATTDLLVLGSRGLGGARAIGSVSERVAHDADCSVLLVR